MRIIEKTQYCWYNKEIKSKVVNCTLLVDKNIKALAQQGKLISQGYNSANVNSISYDLTLGEFVDEPAKTDRELYPGEYFIIKTMEELSIPDTITGRVGEKNSLLRLGLKVDGPQYQPGHTTYAFLRVQNISDKIITLHKGMEIAQIYFEELKETPERPYSAQPGASFQNEDAYRGYGSYDSQYKASLKSFEKVRDDLDHMSAKIYGNVLTLMGILVAIFSMLTINYEAFSNAVLTTKYVIVMNLSLTFCIVVMLGLVLLLINKWKKKWFLWFYIALVVALGIGIFILSL